MVSRKQVIIWMIQAFIPPDLEVVDWGPNGAVVIDRRLQETIREDQGWRGSGNRDQRGINP